MTASQVVAVSLGSGGCRTSSTLYGIHLLVRNHKPSAAEGRAEAPMICWAMAWAGPRRGRPLLDTRFPPVSEPDSSSSEQQLGSRAGESGAGPFVVSPGRPPRAPGADWPLWSFPSVQEGGDGDCQSESFLLASS